MKKLLARLGVSLALLGAIFAPSFAFAQTSNTGICVNITSAPLGIAQNNCVPVSAANPFPVNASASISGFTATSTGTPISVTTGGVTGTLPAGAVVVATNVGSTNGAYCALGASATTSSQYLSPGGGWFAFTVGASTQLTCITSTSTTTVNMTGGSGVPTGTGGGGASSSTPNALTDVPCGSAVSSCVLKASPGNFFGVYADCTSACWLMVFNSVSAPSNGSTTAGKASGNMVECFPVAAGGANSVTYPTYPIALSVGKF